MIRRRSERQPLRKFNAYSDTYEGEVQRSIGFIHQDVDFFVRRKAEILLELTQRHIGDPSRERFLDVGCGAGLTDAYLVHRAGEVAGVDVAAELVKKAAERVPRARYTTYDGFSLPYKPGEFGVSFAICVLHHIPPDRRLALVREMIRVTRSNGLVVLFEHNPLNPLTRLAVSRCAFDEDAVLLSLREATRLLSQAGSEILESPYIIFFPWRSRPLERLEERVVRRLPLGAQYAAVGRRP